MWDAAGSCSICPPNSARAAESDDGQCTCMVGFSRYDVVDGCLCGNGVLDNGEECDDGAGNVVEGACTATCTSNVCGDGMVGLGDGEACDDGNLDNGDGCSAICVAENLLCDLVRSCGSFANETCNAHQSTFSDWDGVPSALAVDGSESTCAETADAQLDSNPQWVRVALGAERVVGTVRFWSDAGAASDLRVLVTAEDATVPPASEAPRAQGANPSVGATLPTLAEECAVASTATAGVFEASCGAPATKGAFVFILRAAPKQALRVCDVEAFQHSCLADDGKELECDLGLQPSSCEDCRGCVPCPAGFYSDKLGPYKCTPCPGSPQPYSPPGSTSVFQCQGDAVLDGTSTLEVEDVTFNQTIDSWQIDIEFQVAPRIEINGISTLFMSKGGAVLPANGGTFQSKNFPCRADKTRAAGSDLSTSLSETVCCLQNMRQDYLMTEIFRDYTDTLDLVAANDECDAAKGSDELVGADLDVVGEEGTAFVDADGNDLSTSITVELLPPLIEVRRSDGTYAGSQRARITIPDAELYKVSKSANTNGEGNLTDSRELFIGLLDLLPTGTRVVDSASQQISIVLTRTQYGTFAAYGEQNIDYDFISFLNGRVHEVFDQAQHAYYAEITYVYDDRLDLNASDPVDIATVTAGEVEDACVVSVDSTFSAVVEKDCGPNVLGWDDVVCPQVSKADDKVGRLYIPLSLGAPPATPDGTVKITFKLVLKDGEGLSAELNVALDLQLDNFVSWCAAAVDSVDLTANVVPSMIIGTESANPDRLTDFAETSSGEVDTFNTEAETLQDGLITMVLDIALNETNLKIHFEDVLVVLVNPGSSLSATDLEGSHYVPTYTYDPESRDASLVLPLDLNSSCPETTFSESFFGCVHKHVLKDEKVTNAEWAYLVGSNAAPAGSGAQDFMQTMLGSGTASDAARELGRDYEKYLTGTAEGIGTNKRIGLWINPGHVWGQTVHNSEYSLSQNVIVYVLYKVESGVDGTVTRRLLQATPSGSSMLSKTLKYDVTAATLVQSAMGNVVALEVQAELALSAEEACESKARLLEICSARIMAAVVPHASKVERVECVSVQVENANCDGSRRTATAPLAVVDAVVALAESPDAFLDMEAVVASGSVLAMTQTAGKPFPSAQARTPDNNVEGPPAAASQSGSNSNTVMVGAAAGAAVGVVLVALGAWKAAKQCRAPAEPVSEVVSMVPTGVAQDGSAEKARIEGLLFDCERQ